jgi:hypothetical protein
MACSFGRGVRFRIHNDYVEPSHIEYAKRFDTADFFACYLFKESNADNGTTVVSIVGGSANNNSCAVGISMGRLWVFSDLSSTCRFAIIDHCDQNYENDVIGCVEYFDMFKKDGHCDYSTLNADNLAAFTLGINNGRNGNGIIYLLWASGNTYEDAGEDTNFQSYNKNTWLTIDIWVMGRDEWHSLFPTVGATLYVH